ncbi:uncharacterized protein DS421_15g500530 [Arachis hypogaea]|nr:uncharacterized protein DS421_15g500530 [Arachis hypogaea]
MEREDPRREASPSPEAALSPLLLPTTLLHEPEELVSVGTAAPNPAAPPSLRRRRADLRRRREPRWGKGSRRLVAGLLVAGCCRELAAAVVKDLPFPCCRWREGDRNE